MHYNGANSYLFVNGTEIIKFKAKDSEIAAYPLCLGNISKDFSVDKMRKIGLKGYVYVFRCNVSSVNFLNAILLNAAPLNATPLKCVSMKNQECKIRPKIININSNKY